eukprot:274708-Amphidinium_carterae.1
MQQSTREVFVKPLQNLLVAAAMPLEQRLKHKSSYRYGRLEVARMTCPVDILPSNLTRDAYSYPQGRGHPTHYGQPRVSFGGEACNLSLMLSWKWSHPQGQYAAVTTGKPVYDSEAHLVTHRYSIR